MTPITASSHHAPAAGDKFRFEPRGAIEVKGKGLMETYFLAQTGTGQWADSTFNGIED